MMNAFGLRPPPPCFGRKKIEQGSVCRRGLAAQFDGRRNDGAGHAGQGPLLDGVESANGFDDGSKKLHADGPWLRRGPDVEYTTAMRSLFLFVHFCFQRVSVGNESLKEFVQFDFLGYADGFDPARQRMRCRCVLEEGLNAGDNDGRTFRAHALLQCQKAIADQVGMRRAATRGRRFAGREEGYLRFLLRRERHQVLVKHAECSRAIGDPDDGSRQ